jgi:hypothetical protein
MPRCAFWRVEAFVLASRCGLSMSGSYRNRITYRSSIRSRKSREGAFGGHSFCARLVELGKVDICDQTFLVVVDVQASDPRSHRNIAHRQSG